MSIEALMRDIESLPRPDEFLRTKSTGLHSPLGPEYGRIR